MKVLWLVIMNGLKGQVTVVCAVEYDTQRRQDSKGKHWWATDIVCSPV